MRIGKLAGWIAVFAVSGQLLAAPKADAPKDEATKDAAREAIKAQLKTLTSRLKYQTGQIKLSNGLATIKLSEAFRYLDPAGTETLLTGIWGNPPSHSKSLGAIVPADFDPLDRDTWCVVIDYTADGYVKDDDAEKINYKDLLEKMQEGTREASKERVKDGYPAIDLVGWATPPRYDKQTHKFYWAKEIKFGDETVARGDHTLNYNFRVLGRGGVLELNAIASMSQLAQIEKASPEILQMVEFDAGNKYADFKPGVDKMATYGLAALVAGGIAAKTGLLKGLFIALLAAKKLVIVAFVAIVAFIKRIFGGKKAEE